MPCRFRFSMRVRGRGAVVGGRWSVAGEGAGSGVRWSLGVGY